MLLKKLSSHCSTPLISTTSTQEGVLVYISVQLPSAPTDLFPHSTRSDFLFQTLVGERFDKLNSPLCSNFLATSPQKFVIGPVTNVTLTTNNQNRSNVADNTSNAQQSSSASDPTLEGAARQTLIPINNQDHTVAENTSTAQHLDLRLSHHSPSAIPSKHKGRKKPSKGKDWRPLPQRLYPYNCKVLRKRHHPRAVCLFKQPYSRLHQTVRSGHFESIADNLHISTTI